MAKFFTDFSEYTIGEFPQDWDAHNAVNTTGNTQFFIDSNGNLRTETVPMDFSVDIVTWDKVPQSDTMEILVKVQVPSSVGDHAGDGVFGLCFISDTAEYNFLEIQTGGLFISSQLTNISGDVVPESSLCWIRFKQTTSELMGKLWLDGNAEPSSWDLTIESTTMNIAQTGFRFIGIEGNTFIVEQFSVGTDGDSAPMSVTTKTYQIQNGVDDGYFSYYDLDLFDTGNALVVGYGADFKPYLNFKNIDIPKGTTITNAYLQLQLSLNYDELAEVNIKIYDADSYESPTAFDEYSEPVLSDTVTWNYNKNTVGYMNTPSIANLIQEIVNRSGWVSGNNIGVALTSMDSYESIFYSFEGGHPPKLIIEYEEPVADTTPPAEVTDYRELYYGDGYYDLCWTDPTDADFSHCNIYRNGTLFDSVAKGEQVYMCPYITVVTTWKITTVDISGNESAGVNIKTYPPTGDVTLTPIVSSISNANMIIPSNIIGQMNVSVSSGISNADSSMLAPTFSNLTIVDKQVNSIVSTSSVAMNSPTFNSITKGYIVERKVNDGDWNVLTYVTDTTSQIDDTDVEVGNTYSYRVTKFKQDMKTEPSDVMVEEYGVVPPKVTIVSVTRSKISDEIGYDKATITFTVDKDITSWEARATLEGEAEGEGIGKIVGDGVSNLAGTEISFDVDYTELTQGDSRYKINIYVEE